MRCVFGCKIFTGGEIRHHKDCPFYPESFSEMYDDLKAKVEKDKKSYRKKLILSLASNPQMKSTRLNGLNQYEYSSKLTAQKIIRQADAIIKEMEKENE